MIGKSFITTMLTEAPPPEKHRGRDRIPLFARNRRPQVTRIGKQWQRWDLIEPRLSGLSPCATIEGVSIWKLGEQVYVAEKGDWFKASSTIDQAIINAGYIARGKELCRVRMKF